MTVSMRPDLSGMGVAGGVELLDGDGCRIVGIRLVDPPDVGDHTWLVSIVLVRLPPPPAHAPHPAAKPPAARPRIHGGLWLLCVVAGLWWLWFLAYTFGAIR